MQVVENLLHASLTQTPQPQLRTKDLKLLSSGTYDALSRYVRNKADALNPAQRTRLREIAKAIGYQNYLRRQIRKTKKWDRALYLRCLANLADPDDIPIFQDMLENEGFLVGIYSAAIGLANCGHTESIPRVIQRGLSKHPPNNDMLLAVLMKFGPRGCPVALEFLFQSEYAPVISCLILDYIGHVGQPEVADDLRHLLRSDQNSDVRAHTIDALSQLGSATMVKDLVPFLTDPDYRVRIKAVNAVEHLGGEEYAGHIAEALEDTNPWVRRSAAEALTRLGETGNRRLRVYPDSGPAGETVKTVLAQHNYQRLRMRYRHARLAA